jgi:hypothetical protein
VLVSPRNLVCGVACPPVICQRRGPTFRWHDGTTWREGDALPIAIARALPGPEWSRCESHRYRRMGDRRAA